MLLISRKKGFIIIITLLKPGRTSTGITTLLYNLHKKIHTHLTEQNLYSSHILNVLSRNGTYNLSIISGLTVSVINHRACLKNKYRVDCVQTLTRSFCFLAPLIRSAQTFSRERTLRDVNVIRMRWMGETSAWGFSMSLPDTTAAAWKSWREIMKIGTKHYPEL